MLCVGFNEGELHFTIRGLHFTTYKKASKTKGGVLITTTEVVHFLATSSPSGGAVASLVHHYVLRKPLNVFFTTINTIKRI